MRILAICNTPYQMLCIVNLKMYTFQDDEMDIIVSDHTMRSEQLVKAVKTCGLFTRSYHAKTFDYCRRLGRYKNISRKEFYSKSLIENILPIDVSYDLLLLNNVDPFADRLYEKCSQINSGIKVFAFEDGYATYSFNFYGDSIKHIREAAFSKREKLLSLLYGKKQVANYIDKLFAFSPEKMDWDPPFEVQRMPLISRDDLRMKQIFNDIFSYNSAKETYDTKYIFFEECYRREGTILPDVLLLEIISSWVGKENIMVKVHPRSGNDLFEKLGYKVNHETSIPWEVICMNENILEDKILITISSGCVSTPYTVMGLPVKSIVLQNLLYGIGENQLGLYHQWLDKYIYQQATDLFYLPNTLDELKSILTKNIFK